VNTRQPEGNKPLASLSVDLDNQWSYMKIHGDRGWDSFPSYLDLVVPRILRLLDDLELTATFFIVGQDAALRKNHPALRSIAAAGHEVANHSFHHDPWIHLATERAVEDELALAEEHIERATGQRPVGYRAPGYSLSEATLRALKRRHYIYDASTLPTFIGPLARAYYFVNARLSVEEKQQRKALFGSFSDGLRPLRTYRWKIEADETTRALIEIPVTTFPFLRIPFHFSYILYLAGYSELLALTYFRMALSACRIVDVQPSLLLHPLDFLGADDLKGLEFFPAMNLSGETKQRLVRQALVHLTAISQVSTIKEHALRYAEVSAGKMVERRYSGGNVVRDGEIVAH
jgi:peptidoglycan/xylan/chitin deacetylase (PgdA/CDA1 family)